MILHTLVLHNFRKYNHETIEFPEGVTGVIGLNGSGKSTIFEAVAWALYGPVAARTSADMIKRNGAAPSDPCRVELVFSLDGNIYKVIREMTGKSQTPSAMIWMNDNKYATGAGEVTKCVQKLLGMDYKNFYTSIFAKQKELNALSSMNASERRPLILKMLGIDALDEIIKHIGSDRRAEETLIGTLQTNLIDQNGHNKIDQLHNKIHELNTQKKNFHEEIVQTKKSLSNVKSNLLSQQKSTREKRELSENLSKTLEQLIDLKNRFDSREKLTKEIASLKQKIQYRHNEVDPLKKKILSSPDFAHQLSQLETRLVELDVQLQEHVKIMEQKKISKQENKNVISKYTRKHTDIKTLGSQASCPTCERLLGDQYQLLLTKYEKEIQQKTDENQSLDEAITVQDENLQRLKREITALKKKKEFLFGQQTEKQSLIATLSILQKELLKEESELKLKQTSLENFGSVSFDPEKYLAVRHQVKTSYQEYQQALKHYDALKDKYNSIRLVLEKKQSTILTVTNEIATIQERIKELKEMQNTIGKKQKIKEDLSLLQETMTSFRSFIISRIRPVLSSYASLFFQQLTDGKYQEISLDEEYNMHLFDEGKSYAIERFSGGEIDLANLCIRLAISEVITERSQGVFQLIILDEIFGSQDSIRQQNIMGALNQLSSKFHQIFLITHVEEVKHHVRSIIQVEESNGRSTAQLV